MLLTKYLVLSILVTLTVNGYCLRAQSDYPIEGQPFPSVIFSDVSYSNKKQVNISDFRGKWVVLDFFSSGCTACFKSFGKMDHLRDEFRDSVEFILVGRLDSNIKKSYERYRVAQNLKLTVAYDSSIFKRFGIVYVPYIVVLDSEGIVRAITTGLEEHGLKMLMAGQKPALPGAKNIWQEQQEKTFFDKKKLLFVDNNGGSDSDFLYRSVLGKWNSSLLVANPDHISAARYKLYGHFQLVGLDLKRLYDVAYGDTLFRGLDDRGSSYGKYWREPILEVSDSSDFIADYDRSKNLYCYSLIVPNNKVTAQYLREIMRNDLDNYFGYEVVVEERMMPYWSLVYKGSGKDFKSRGSKQDEKNIVYAPNTGFGLVNAPMSILVNYMYMYFSNEPPFVDETGVLYNIDIDVDAIMTSFDDVRGALKKYSLHLVKSKKMMKVIVIKDKRNHM